MVPENEYVYEVVENDSGNESEDLDAKGAA